MIQNMVLSGGGGSGGSAEIKTSAATASSGEIVFEVDGVPTWFLLYAVYAPRPTSSSISHLVMAYDEVDLNNSDYSNNSYYISYYGDVSLKDDRPVEYWYENGTFWLGQYGSYDKIRANTNYVLCYTT